MEEKGNEKSVDLPATDEIGCQFDVKAGILVLEYEILLGLRPAWMKLHLTHKAAIELLRRLDEMREEIQGARPTKSGMN